MKIAIMQPYYFPYLGYFQLINAVDTYVNLDHVSFMKRSYMVRNTLKDNVVINVPIIDASQYNSCVESYVSLDFPYEKFEKTIKQLYGKSPNFTEIYNRIIYPILCKRYNSFHTSISEWNLDIIKNICNYLLINTQIIDSSVGLTNEKKSLGLIEICGKYNGSNYINAIGGLELYNKEEFKQHNIDLNFIKMGNINFPNPNLSILHHLFTQSKEKIQEELNNYTLI